METHTYVRMTTEEANARDVQSAWSALYCWRNYHPDYAQPVTAIMAELTAGTITGREALHELFNMQLADATGGTYTRNE